MNNNKRYQVAIVGGGPIGVALAIDLGLGTCCILIERRTDPQRIPKGRNLTQRSVGTSTLASRMSCALRACCRLITR
jgi:2-polyprenyl-6-methoxyphenol hydroxylase-like FAD-dependent oxidoreductase